MKMSKKREERKIKRQLQEKNEKHKKFSKVFYLDKNVPSPGASVGADRMCAAQCREPPRFAVIVQFLSAEAGPKYVQIHSL